MRILSREEEPVNSRLFNESKDRRMGAVIRPGVGERVGFSFHCGGSARMLLLLMFLFPLIVSSENLSGPWRFDNGGEFPGATGALVRNEDTVVLKYDFTAGGNYVGGYYDLDPPKELGAVRFYLKKPLEAVITFRVTDASGQCFQKQIFYETVGERHITLDMNGWAGHWGGADDGILRQPLSSLGILVEAAGLDAPQGEITFRAVSCDQAAAKPDPVSQEEATGTVLSYQVTDFGGNCVLARSVGGQLQSGIWRIDYSSGQPAAMRGSLSLFYHPVTLTMRARSSAPGAALVFDIGAHFQNFKRTVGVFNGTDQVFTFTLPPEGWDASGAAHTTLHYPLRITGIAVERNECKEDRLDIQLGEINCETKLDAKAPTVAMARLLPGPVKAGERPFTLAVDLWNLLQYPVEGAVTVRVRNWEGAELAESAIPVSLPARGLAAHVEHRFSAPAALRYVEAGCTLEADGLVPAEALSAFTAVLTEEVHQERLPQPDRSLVPESPWGMGVYLYRYSNSGRGLEEMDRAAALAEDAGVKWTREEFNYSMIEKEPGVYDFSFFDSLVQTAARHGISVYGLLAYWSPFIEQPYSEEGITAYCDYARATVGHFKDSVHHWEIYNEPNIFFWNGPKELYPELVRRVYAVIKEEDPNASVLAVSTAGIDRAFIRKVVEAGAPFDALTVHPYRSELLEGKFIRELRGAAKLAEDRPVWITEMGWSTQINGGKSEREQAQLLARAYLTAAGAGVRSMGWYNFRNDGDDPFYNEENFGVLYRDFRPKAAYRALATVCRCLAVSGNTRPMWLEGGDGSSGLYALSVGSNTALWNSEPSTQVIVSVVDKEPVVLNLMGETLSVVRVEPPEGYIDGPTPGAEPRAEAGGCYTISLHGSDPVFVLGAPLRLVSMTSHEPADSAGSKLRF